MKKSPYEIIQELSEVYYGAERVKVIKKAGSIKNISSGVSSLNLPTVYKQLLCDEINSDSFYKWYTGSEGTTMGVASILFFENYLAGNGRYHFFYGMDNVAISVGTTELIALYFQYLAEETKNRKVLLLGLNYFLFYECCKENNLECFELMGNGKSSTLPAMDELLQYLEEEEPDVFVLSVPSNPSGEMYTEEEFERLFHAIAQTDIKVLIDRVCLDEISYSDVYINFNYLIEKYDLLDQIFMVNGLSKSRNLAGMRIGYCLASKEIINFIKKKNYIMMFSAPSTGVTMLSFDMFLRSCLYAEYRNRQDAFGEKVNRKELYSVYLKHMKTLCPLTPCSLKKNNVRGFFPSYEKVEKMIQQTVGELEQQYEIIKRNIDYAIEVLQPYLESYTTPVHGFNFVVKFRDVKELQVERAIRVFREFGVELLTEHCFRSSCGEKQFDYWIRITAAAPEEWFQQAVQKLVESIEVEK